MLHFNTIGSVFVASAGVVEPVVSAGAEEFEHPASTPKSKVRQVAIASPFFINTPLKMIENVYSEYLLGVSIAKKFF